MKRCAESERDCRDAPYGLHREARLGECTVCRLLQEDEGCGSELRGPRQRAPGDARILLRCFVRTTAGEVAIARMRRRGRGGVSRLGRLTARIHELSPLLSGHTVRCRAAIAAAGLERCCVCPAEPRPVRARLSSSCRLGPSLWRGGSAVETADGRRQ
jgi:hypothetical protein